MPVQLNVRQKRVLSNIRYRSQEKRFDQPTLNELQKMGLAASVCFNLPNGRLSVNRRWSITDAGIATYEGRAL